MNDAYVFREVLTFFPPDNGRLGVRVGEGASHLFPPDDGGLGVGGVGEAG